MKEFGNQKRMMAFYEVGRQETEDGYYYPVAEDIQKSFNSIQKKAEQSGKKQTLTLKLTVHPRSDSNEKFGQVEYELNETFPKRKSKKMYTELNDQGMVVATGDSPINIDQINLFPQTNITKINGAQ